MINKCYLIPVLTVIIILVYNNTINNNTTLYQPKIFLTNEEIYAINQLDTSLLSGKNYRYLILIRINQNTCVSCMMELEFWNQLENNPELEIVAVLEDSSFVSDLPESLRFQFPFILKDNFIFYFTELGDVEKILIDRYVNRIMFIDYASTSHQAHLAFKKVIEAILSYP